MQCYKVTKSVTIHSFKVDPTRSSQRFCPSLTMLQILLQASPSSRMLETLAGLCCWARRSPASLTFSHAVHLKRDGRLLPGALHGASSCGVICSPAALPWLLLHPGPHSAFADVSKPCHAALGRGKSATLMNGGDSVHHRISTSADTVKVTVGVSTTRWI